MYGLLIAKNLSTRSRYSHSLCVSANTKIKLKLKQLKLSDWTSAMFCWLFVCSAIDFIFSLLFEFSVNNCEKKVKLVKHLHSMQMVRDLTTAFRLCRSYSPVRLCALCFYPVCFFGAVSFPRFKSIQFLRWSVHKITVARVNLLLNPQLPAHIALTSIGKLDFIPIIAGRKEGSQQPITSIANFGFAIRKLYIRQMSWTELNINHTHTRSEFDLKNWFCLKAH